MEEYIPKSALVAEIERRLQERQEARDKAMWNDDYWPESNFCIRDNEDEELLTIINAFEAKEVDLDEETLHSELRKIYTSIYDSKDIKSAKHFFELGLKAQKGINQ